MERTSSPKHARPLDGPERLGFFTSLQAGDVAAWAQAGIMASPFLAYLFVYSLKRYSFASFGVSTALITVKLEDVLWIAAVLMLPCVTTLIQWALTTLSSKNRMATTIWFSGLISLCSLLSLAVLTLVLSFRSRVFDLWPYGLMVIQLMILAAFFPTTKRRSFLGELGALRMLLAYLLAAALLVFAVVRQTAYLSFHGRSYQICDSRNALIVSFDSQGKAIEKQIVNVSDNGVCELAPGYRIEDITGEQLHLESFNYVLVDE